MGKKLTVPILLICLGLLSGAASYEGMAETGMSSQFQSDGLFASSSIFPEGRLVDVTALTSGKILRVLIVGAPKPGASEHFLLLAPQAGAALDLKPGSGFRAEVRLADSVYSPIGQAGQAATTDPDYNMKLLAARGTRSGNSDTGVKTASTSTSPLLDGVFLVESSGKTSAASWPSHSVATDRAPAPLSRSGTSPQADPGLQQRAAITPSVAAGFGEVGYYYLQVGAFGTASAMKTVMREFSPFFPMDVRLFMQKGKPHYRLLVGPLSTKELVMARARARAFGILDAFVTDGK